MSIIYLVIYLASILPLLGAFRFLNGCFEFVDNDDDKKSWMLMIGIWPLSLPFAVVVVVCMYISDYISKFFALVERQGESLKERKQQRALERQQQEAEHQRLLHEVERFLEGK